MAKAEMLGTLEDRPEETGNVQKDQAQAGEQGSGQQSTAQESQSQSQEVQQTPTKVDEPTVEIDGEKLPLSEIKRLREERKNDAEWKKNNTIKSEELARKERELQDLIALRPYLQQRPEIVQQLFQPAPQRDYDKELSEHYSQRPEDFADGNVRREWEQKRDNLLYQKSVADAEVKVREQVQQTQAFNHNQSLDVKAKDKYGAKVNSLEFQSMVDWIRGHIRPSNGMYPEDSYDIAYKNLHEDRYLQDLKVSTTQRIVDTLNNPNLPKGQGENQRAPVKTAQDEQDDALVAAVKSKSKGKWKRLS